MTAGELSRTEARTRALELLFAADLRGVAVADLLEARETGWVDGFTRLLVETVAEHAEAIDALIGTQARGWTLDRMPLVDRNVLRVALYELRAGSNVPPKVAINEAVELAKEFGGETSGRFVNGVLGSALEAREA